MPVPFGFSASDFVAAIALTVKIGKALRESGGATTECRLVLHDLQLLRQMLEFLQGLQPVGFSATYLNAVRGMALTCLVPLREFSDKLDKSYGPVLGEGSTANAFRRGGKKVQWALFAADEVGRFRAVVAAKVVSISVLLGMCNQEALSTIQRTTQETRDAQQIEVAERKQDFARSFSALALEGSRNHTSLLANVVQSRQELKEDVSHFDEQQHDRHQELNEKLEEQQERIRSLENHVTDLCQDTSSHYRDLVGICCGLRTGNRRALAAVRQDSQQIKAQLTSIQIEQRDSGVEASLGFRSLLLQVRMLYTVGNNILNLLLPFSERVLGYLRSSMATNMEIFTLLQNLQATLPTLITPNEADCILFEDVLGRKMKLPYTYFRHWDVFESMLHCEFKGLPGEGKILGKRFVLLHGSIGDTEITHNDWGKLVFPATQVKMSMSMRILYQDRRLYPCLRRGCLGLVRQSSKTIVTHCPKCGLRYFARREGNAELDKVRDCNLPVVLSGSRATVSSYLSQQPVSNVDGSLNPVPDLENLIQMLNTETEELSVFRAVHVVQALKPPGSGYGLPVNNIRTAIPRITDHKRATFYEDAIIWYEPAFS